jgi:hypothetical protein
MLTKVELISALSVTASVVGPCSRRARAKVDAITTHALGFEVPSTAPPAN